ncbi:hypothetical protein Slala05_67180 [Streptomyces lavendulae subsp. lavendulae]|nr:hypothetical protein Slala05_67180 [Streptomyces lavendulae subsp. lavendulae]
MSVRLGGDEGGLGPALHAQLSEQPRDVVPDRLPPHEELLGDLPAGEALADEFQKGGRPAGFDSEICKRRNEGERTINRLKNSRAVATRYDKRAYVFHGTVTVAAIRLWLRP